MEKKQSSVDFIYNAFNLLSDADFKAWMLNNHDVIEAMHKDEMRDLYLSHVTKAERLRVLFEKQFEEYYTNTFGGNNA